MYADTKEGLTSIRNTFYVTCMCGNSFRIDEDQFLGRSDIECSECRLVYKSDLIWERKLIRME